MFASDSNSPRIPARPAQLRAPGAALVLPLLLAATSAMGAAEDRGIAQFGVEHWNADQGLDGNWVRDIVEGSNGMLWIATGSGLSRFDGRVFTAIPGAAIGDVSLGPVTALARGPEGTIWLARDYGGIHQLGADGSRHPGPLPTLPEQTLVRTIRSDASGTLWMGTSRGLWRFADAAIERIVIEADGNDADVTALVAAPDGGLWVRTRDHGIKLIADGIPMAVPDVRGCRGNGFALGPGGERYTSCLEGVWRWDARQSRWLPLSADRGVGRLFVDRRGGLWFGQRRGLSRWSNGALEVLPVNEGVGDWRIRALAEDTRGDLWVGSFSVGVARLRRGPVIAVGRQESLPLEATSAVLAAPDGSVWIGGLDQGLWSWHPDSGVRTRWTANDGLPGATAWALAADPRYPGGIWVGGDAGIAWLEGGRITATGPGGIVHSDPTNILYIDPAQPDTLWAGGETGGAVELQPGKRIVHDARAGFPLQRVRLFHRDRTGRLLVGGDEGLFARDGRQWITQEIGGRPLRGVTAVAEDGDGGLWIASNRDGLMHRIDNRSSTYRRSDGLPFGTIHALELDAYGGLWLSGDEGIARLRLDDHARWERGELDAISLERLGRGDGLRDAECNGWGRPASTRLADGRIVYPTISGIALLDARALRPSELTPERIYLREAWSGTRALSLKGPVQLAADERALRIGFSAIELSRPEAIAFRYRLDGFDADWTTASRSAEASWSRMAAGSFLFRLQARVPGQDWIDAPQPLAIEVEYLAWESPWLRAAAAIALLSLVGTAVAWRLRVGTRHARSLARARTFLRAVIDTSPNPMFVRDRDGSYVLANRAAGDVYGLLPEAIEGRTPEQIGPTPPGMAQIDALDAEVIASGEERVAAEDELIDHLGRRRWFRVVKRPGFAADGRTVEQVIGTAVDVTEFKLAEQRVQREQAKLQRSREEARRLSRRLLRAQEDERRRLAREIHDDLTQQLAGLSMLAWSTAQAAAREPSRDVSANLTELASELERIANEVQALSRELHPPALEAFGLAETVRAECETFGKRTGMSIEFECRGAFADPAPEVGLALYRIVQEGLRNCLAHADTTSARVVLEGGEGAIRLQIIDSGVGFDASDATARPGLGLLSMRERAHLAGASLRIDSAIGAGTRIEIRYPAVAEPEATLPQP